MNAQEFAKILDEIDTKIARVRALYESYFQGTERLEPTIARRDIERNIDMVKRGCPNNTSSRFRLNTLLARYSTYAAYWQRTCRQIEDGTYHKQHERMGRRKRTNGARNVQALVSVPPVQEVAFDDQELNAFMEGMDAARTGKPPAKVAAAPASQEEDDDVDTLPPAAKTPEIRVRSESASKLALDIRTSPSPPRTPARTGSSFAPPKVVLQKDASKISVPAPPRSPRPRTATPPRVQVATKLQPAAPKMPPRPAPRETSPEENMQKLFERYVDARQKNNESTERVRYETVVQTVEKMMPKLREKHGNKAIDFDVILVDGKVGIKPKIRE